MITTTGTSGRDATLSANLGEHQRHVPSAVAMHASRVQLQESVKVLEEIEITSLRVLGASHFLSNQIKINLERARKKLARAEGISGSNLSR